MSKCICDMFHTLGRIEDGLKDGEDTVQRFPKFTVVCKKRTNGNFAWYKRTGCQNQRKETRLNTPLKVKRAWEYSVMRIQASHDIGFSWKAVTRLKETLRKCLKKEYDYFTEKYEGLPRPSYNKNHTDGLIHRTVRGELVRSKSEVIIANALHAAKIDYYYEFPYAIEEGNKGDCYPDFTIPVSIQGRPVYWEHCGMTSNPEYAVSWLRKMRMYQREGILENVNLIVTYDSYNGDIDSYEIQSIIDKWFVVK